MCFSLVKIGRGGVFEYFRILIISLFSYEEYKKSDVEVCFSVKLIFLTVLGLSCNEKECV